VPASHTIPAMQLAAHPHRERLAEAVIRDLEGRIATGELAAGALLDAEASLAAQHRVSSRVIREALGALAARGLVEVIPGKGTVVRGVDAAALRDFFLVAARGDGRGLWDLFELRKVVEVQIAGLAARRASAADVTRCEESFHRLELAQATPEDYVEADIDFHQAVAAAAGNRILALVLEGLRDPLRRGRTRSWQGRIRVGHEVADQVDMHRRILVAVRRHQPRAAELAMAHHLDLAELHLRAAEGAPGPCVPEIVPEAGD
jgi:GntR family transcriptional repressor for pyruvate dehydrogenase complex